MSYKLVENISWRQIDNQVLILDSRINKQAHELNPLASHIWIETDQGVDINSIIENLSQKYPHQSKDQLSNDVLAFSRQMLDLGLFVEL